MLHERLVLALHDSLALVRSAAPGMHRPGPPASLLLGDAATGGDRQPSQMPSRLLAGGGLSAAEARRAAVCAEQALEVLLEACLQVNPPAAAAAAAAAARVGIEHPSKPIQITACLRRPGTRRSSMRWKGTPMSAWPYATSSARHRPECWRPGVTGSRL